MLVRLAENLHQPAINSILSTFMEYGSITFYAFNKMNLQVQIKKFLIMSEHIYEISWVPATLVARKGRVSGTPNHTDAHSARNFWKFRIDRTGNDFKCW